MSVFTVPSIVILTYLIMEFVKHIIFKGNRDLYKYIPLIAATCGLTLSIIGFYCIPDLFLHFNLFEAIIAGIFSGLSATGTNQIFKQIKK